MEQQLFEKVFRSDLMVGNKKIKRYLMVLSALFHLTAIVIWLAIISVISGKPDNIPELIIASSHIPSYFYESEPMPPPPLKQKVRSKKTEKLSKELQESVTLAPVEVPNEIKPESSKEPEKNLSDDTESTMLGNDSDEQGGIVGGVPGGVVGQSSISPGSSPPSQEPIIINGDSNLLKIKKYSHPKYPDVALAAKIQGAVIIEAVIGKNGKIKNMKIIKSIVLLDSAALNAVGKWEYMPLVIDGEVREVLLTVTVIFKIK